MGILYSLRTLLNSVIQVRGFLSQQFHMTAVVLASGGSVFADGSIFVAGQFGSH
jgi:hypothetical protein